MHTYLTLPSYLFIDKYQFSDPLFLESHHLKNLRSLSGETDLEAPDWVIKQWGSAALFELADPPTNPQGKPKEPWTVTIPLHLRYLSPTNHTASSDSSARPGEQIVDVPWPIVFWACHGEISGSKMAVNPFDRVNLGYDGLFGDRTVFYHVPPYLERTPDEIAKAKHGMNERLHVPVLDLEKASSVGLITIIVVTLGAGLVALLLLRGLRAGQAATSNQKVKVAKKDEKAGKVGKKGQ